MSGTDAPLAPAPVPASRHPVVPVRRRIDPVTLLTVYLVLLLAVPSNTTIAALGSLGRPSLLWGLVLMVFWAVSRLQARSFDVRGVSQPVRFAFGALVVVALVSFAVALLRGQPSDQVSPAFTALLRLASWAGVFLVAIDGLRTMNDLARMVRAVVIGASLLAALGIAQFLTGQAIIDFWSSLPGLSGPGAGVAERGGVVRSAGTAIHPLEYASTITAVLPLAIAAGASRGFRWRHGPATLVWWLPVALIAVSSLVGVSRSAVIGFAIGAIGMIPALPRRFRFGVLAGGLGLAAVVVVAIPGLLSTTLGLFTGAGDDPSTLSRVNGLDRAPEFIASSPVVGSGFGIFLPRYYIFDNQWVLMAVELGLLGIIAFAGFLAAAVWSAARARAASTERDVRLLGYALAVSMIVIGVMFAFFDGLSFPISAGVLFLLAGMCGSIRTVGAADAAIRALQPVIRSAPEDE
ncbi:MULTISPECIES: O-antigen ligase family protein [Microbacterium]|uniref:O-antigen ligase family protein n=1 Tax=Microbacterium TaxID=33882 RepID=UPI00146B0889|nr:MULTISPECIES: O-antigen ligase family protein [Microbacterium]